MDAAALDDDPLRQVDRWLQAARAAGERMPEAMCVATATPDGVPSARMVLLRGIDRGLVFFTDYESAKGAEIEANPKAAAVLHFLQPVHRQVRAVGGVERTTAAESDRYWHGRPPASRRSAIASHQSEVIDDRRRLQERVAALLGDPDPGRPPRWGGFRIVPDTVELWEEGEDRLHDRFRYVHAGGSWRIERLSP
jgi:pyridoxamine 5'-phosphate oxidase